MQKNDLKILAHCPLFEGMEEQDLQAVLHCLSSRKRSVAREEYLFRAGDNVAEMGVVLRGRVHIIQEDFWGNRTIFAHVEPGELFGEAFCCAGLKRLPVSAVAREASEILSLDFHRIFAACPVPCTYHTNLINNMMRVIAQKNVQLTRKMEVLSMRTTREKLLVFLSEQAREQGSSCFSVPFDRQQLADYLCINRSALSRELSQMQRDGMLRYHKDKFELLE